MRYECDRCGCVWPNDDPPFDDDECGNCYGDGEGRVRWLDESEQRDLRYDEHCRLAAG